jgi:D-cysteine desulfhydrase
MVGERPMFFSLVSHTFILNSRNAESKSPIPEMVCVDTAERLDIKGGVKREDILCFDQYVGPGYSVPTGAMVEAVKLFAKNEAILLDPVYSGKTAAGLIDIVRKGHFSKGSNVLLSYWRVTGLVCLYGYVQAVIILN